MPRFSDSTRPASFSFAMWCEIVGCERSSPAVKSQMQIGIVAFASEATMVSRVGSASALMSSARLSAQLAFTTGRVQHTPRSRIIGSSLTATTCMIHYPSKVIDGFKEPLEDERDQRGGAVALRGHREAAGGAARRLGGQLLYGRRHLRLRLRLLGGRAERGGPGRGHQPGLREPDHAG